VDRRDPQTGKPTYTAGAFAIVRDDSGRVLWIQRRDTGWWGLPGGVIEFGETPAEAVVRETLEESGFTVEVLRLAAVDWKRAVADGVFVFECRITGGTATPSEESSEVRFFGVAEPPEAPAHIISRIQDVIASPDRVLLYSTDVPSW
jgi:8-oxo-dGTP pyrophosphatase MutT (NUDIX family)